MTAVLTPLLTRSGWNACLPLAAMLCVGAPILSILRRQPIRIDNSRLAAAAAVFAVVAMMAFVAGQYPWFPVAPAPMRAQVAGLALFVVSSGIFMYVGHRVTSLVELQRLTWFFICFGGAALVTTFVGVFDLSIGPIAVLDATSIGSMFWVWIVAMSFSQGLCNRALSAPIRVFAVGVGCLALTRGVVIGFSWASGWLPPLVTFGVVIALTYPRLAIAIGMLLAVPASVVASQAVSALMAGESYSLMTRLEAARISFEMIKRSPLIGFGPANYYHYTLLFSILGWWVRFNTHNNYLDLAAQCGILGLFAFGWFTLEALLLSVRLRDQVANMFARAYATGVLAGLVGSLAAGALADWIVPFVYNIGIRGFRSSVLFWFFLGGLLALKRIVGQHTAVAARVAATSFSPEPHIYSRSRYRIPLEERW